MDEAASLRLETQRLTLWLPPPEAALACLTFEEENREHFGRWDPSWPPDYFTEAFWRKRLLANQEDWRSGKALRLSFVRKGEELIRGYCALQKIERGDRQTGRLSYGLDHRIEGRGLMTEALEALISYAFSQLRLHRLEAVYLPENERSARLLKRLGFSVEGLMREYALVKDEWRDHLLAARIHPSWGT